MTIDLGETIKEAIPGRAVEIVGFKMSPQTGSVLAVFSNAHKVEKLISERKKLKEFNEVEINKRIIFHQDIIILLQN